MKKLLLLLFALAPSLALAQNTPSVTPPVLAAGAYNASPPTCTTGNGCYTQTDANGNLKVNVVAGSGSGCAGTTGTPCIVNVQNWGSGAVALGAPSNYGTSPGAVMVPGVNAFVTNTNANGQATMSNSSPVTIASDQSPVPVTPAAGTTGGTVQYHLIAANTTNSTSVKASAGIVYSIQTGNIGASAPAYLKFYDKATAPTCNTDTVVKTILIPANSLGGGNNVSIPVGAGFTSGIGICVTGGIADNDNTAVAASTVIINIGYK